MYSKKVLELNFMKRLESQEDYLERILQISQRKESVHAVDIARDMNFSNPVNISELIFINFVSTQGCSYYPTIS